MNKQQKRIGSKHINLTLELTRSQQLITDRISVKPLSSSESKIFLSLVVATVDRKEELILFLDSLLPISERYFEVIVVDQNNDGRLDALLKNYAVLMPVKHIKLSERNASKARNVGVKHANGQWVGFPDDDCCYTPDTIPHLIKAIETSSCEIILGAVTDFKGNALGRFYRRKSRVSLFTINGKVNEPGVFITKSRFEQLNGFNEDFGPGGRYFAAEAYELLVRALKQRKEILFNADIQIRHPNKLSTYDKNVMRIGYTYAYGIGCLLARHFGLWSIHYLLGYIARFLAKLILRNGRRKRYAIYCLRGLLAGFHKTWISGR